MIFITQCESTAFWQTYYRFYYLIYVSLYSLKPYHIVIGFVIMGVINGGIDSPTICSTEGGNSPINTSAMEEFTPNRSSNEDPKLAEIQSNFDKFSKALDKWREEIKNNSDSSNQQQGKKSIVNPDNVDSIVGSSNKDASKK